VILNTVAQMMTAADMWLKAGRLGYAQNVMRKGCDLDLQEEDDSDESTV